MRPLRPLTIALAIYLGLLLTEWPLYDLGFMAVFLNTLLLSRQRSRTHLLGYSLTLNGSIIVWQWVELISFFISGNLSQYGFYHHLTIITAHASITPLFFGALLLLPRIRRRALSSFRPRPATS